MFENPAYGDPTCPEEEFTDLSLGFHQKGLRRIRMAIAHGITMRNRRVRSESRAMYGYGVRKPDAFPTQLFGDVEEYEQAEKRYVGELMQIIQTVDCAGTAGAPKNRGIQ